MEPHLGNLVGRRPQWYGKGIQHGHGHMGHANKYICGNETKPKKEFIQVQEKYMRWHMLGMGSGRSAPKRLSFDTYYNRSGPQVREVYQEVSALHGWTNEYK